jgi:hypothetical protein
MRSMQDATALEAVPQRDLERQIASLGVALSRGMARWLALVGEFDRREAAETAGFRSTSEWLAWACSLSPRAAREHVRVARRLQSLPLVRAAFENGGLSYSQVRALSRAPESEADAALVELASGRTATELDSAVRRLRSAPSSDVETANRSYERRTLDWWWEGDGSLRLHGRLPADDGAVLVEAIETAAEAMHGSRDGSVHVSTEEADARREPSPEGGPPPDRDRSADGEPSPDGETPRRPPRGARRADALAEMARSGCPRTQVVLEVDLEALACTAEDGARRGGSSCALRDGPAVPSETARRLACEADLVLATRPDGELDLGRRRRVVSPPLRASLERRDGGCRFPGCRQRHGTDAHHIEHWVHGGTTDRDNLVLLCCFHHRAVHEGGFTVERVDGDVRFRRPDGRLIPAVPPLGWSAYETGRRAEGHDPGGDETWSTELAEALAPPAPVGGPAP